MASSAASGSEDVVNVDEAVDLRSSDEVLSALQQQAEANKGHSGDWHSAVSDCGLKCAWGLGRKNIGKQHWSCCYVTEEAAPCPKAKPSPPPAPEMPPRPSAWHDFVGDVPHYIVHLDAPASERWSHVIADFTESLPVLIKFVEEVVGTMPGHIGGAFFSAFTHLGIVYYKSELAAIAKLLKCSVGKLAMIQIAYEAFAFCTSIVTEPSVNNTTEPPLHIRTMDWEMPELMPLTIEVEFRVANKPVFVTSTWAGYIGVLTGMRYPQEDAKNGWSVSINYRRTGTNIRDVLTNFLKGAMRSWPVGFLVREVLASTAEYGEAKNLLTNSSLMAPTYITLCGARPGEGAIISRNREGAENIKELTAAEPLIQANMDHWRPDDEYDEQNICDSVGRRTFAKRILDGLPEKSFNDLWCLTRIPPILAHDTVYTVSMSAGLQEYTTQVHATDEDRATAYQRLM